jgi:predicted aspartyl protease
MRSRAYFAYSLMLEVLAGFVLLSNPAFASDIPQRDPVAGLGDPGETVRFQLYQGYLIVAHGSIGAVKNLNIFLDTGTTPSLLDLRIARKLNLRGEDSVSIARLDRRTRAEETNLPSLEIGPLKRSSLRVVTADLSFFEKVLPVHIDAVVGLDMLGQRPFVIDYPARVIRFEPLPALSVCLPLRLDQGLAVIDAEIDHAPVHLLFDTGAGFIVLFNKARARGAGKEDIPAEEAKATSASEEKKVWLRTLQLGAEEFGQKPALLTRNPNPSQLDVDGLVGPAALGISRVAVDLKAGVLAFSR